MVLLPACDGAMVDSPQQALWKAARDGDADMIARTLQQGADVNIQNGESCLSMVGSPVDGWQAKPRLEGGGGLRFTWPPCSRPSRRQKNV